MFGFIVIDSHAAIIIETDLYILYIMSVSVLHISGGRTTPDGDDCLSALRSTSWDIYPQN